MKCPSCRKKLTAEEIEVMKKYSFDVCIECRKRRNEASRKDWKNKPKSK